MNKIYKSTLNTIRILRGKTGLSQANFGKLYGIPTRTIEDWESGARTPADYLVDLLARAVEEDKIYIIRQRDDVTLDGLAYEDAVEVEGHFLTYAEVADAMNEAMDPDQPYTAEDMVAEAHSGHLWITRDRAILTWS